MLVLAALDRLQLLAGEDGGGVVADSPVIAGARRARRSRFGWIGLPKACHWRGLDHFRAYVWSGIAAHNLAVLAGSPLELKPT